MPTFKDLTNGERIILVALLKNKLATRDSIAAWVNKHNEDRSMSSWFTLCMNVKRPEGDPAVIAQTVKDAEEIFGTGNVPSEEQKSLL